MAQDLIARLEAASGPSRGLDHDIWEIVAGEREPASQIYLDCPKFTASIDAALTLVPEGWNWSVSSADPAGRHQASSRCAPVGEGKLLEEFAPTPALALCIVSLRARAA